MSRWQAWSSHILTVLLGTTGIAFFTMKYLMTSDDPFSVVNHPLQPLMLDLHVFSAPLLVFLFGLMFESHIQKKLKGSSRLNRRSGLVATITFGVMTLSGYALQVVAIEILARTALVLHLASSGLFLLSYSIHQAVNFRLWNSARKKGASHLALES